MWCFVQLNSVLFQKRGLALDRLPTSLKLASCGEGHSCCHSHRVKYSIPRASGLLQNCTEWLYVHNAGNINSMCWFRAMRSVVKWHEDTREAMFSGKPAGQCRMHYSNKWFINPSMIYDPVVNIHVVRLCKTGAVEIFRIKQQATLDFDQLIKFCSYWGQTVIFNPARDVHLVEQCKYRLHKASALIEYTEVYSTAITRWC